MRVPARSPGSAYDALFICEGALDSISVWLASGEPGIVATALFGACASPIQLALLRGVRSLFQRVFVMLDADAIGQGQELAGELDAGMIDAGREYGDPAAMNTAELSQLIAYAARSDEWRIASPWEKREVRCR